MGKIAVRQYYFLLSARNWGLSKGKKYVLRKGKISHKTYEGKAEPEKATCTDKRKKRVREGMRGLRLAIRLICG